MTIKKIDFIFYNTYLINMELYKYHKTKTIYQWIKAGLKESEEQIKIIYEYSITCKNCELCNKEFTKLRDRQMEHDHETGKFRNIVCNSCNQLKQDKVSTTNTTGYKGISKIKCKRQQDYYSFQPYINGRQKCIKRSIDLDKLIAYAKEWKIKNNYHT